MDVPWRCTGCGNENMIDLEHLLEWPLDKLLTAEGFVCEYCGTREAVSYSTPSLREAAEKLTRYRPAQKQFRWLFSKLLRKLTGVNQRGELLRHGALEHQDLAQSGSLG